MVVFNFFLMDELFNLLGFFTLVLLFVDFEPELALVIIDPFVLKAGYPFD
jgi:hypothetical protein